MALTKAQLIDMNSNELILDLDADTSLHSSTDDQIDIKIGGADDFTFTANAFNVLTGSHATFADSANAKFGTGNDMLVYHDGSNSYITNATGALKVATETSGIAITLGHSTSEVTVADNLTVSGNLSISGTLTFADGSLAVADLDIDGATDIGASIVDADLFIIDDGAGGTNRKTTASRIATYVGASAGAFAIANLDIDGGTDIGAALADADLFIVDDGAGGTNRKVAASRLPTYISSSTLTAATIDDVAIDGKVITMTGSSSDTAVITAGTNGTLSIVTTDAAAAAANITITADGTFEADGTTITLDSAGDIVLDADGADVIFKDGGTAILTFTNSSSDAVITSGVQDKDIVFKGDDGGAAITALTLDMSAAGAATFNDKVTATELDISGNCDIDGTTNLDAVDIDGAVQIDAAVTVGVNDTGYDVKFFGATSGAYMLWDESTDDLVLAGAAQLYLYDAGGGESLSSDGTDLTINSGAKINLTATSDVHIPNNVGIVFGGDSEKIEGDGTDLTISANNLTIDCAADLILDAAGNNITLKSGGTSLLDFVNSSSDVVIKPMVDAKDIIFQQYDGTSILEINDGAYAKFTAAAVAPEATLTDASTISWNALTQSVAKVTLGANRTMGSASSGVTGQFISLLVIQDGTGSRTVSWNAAYEFAADTAPTLTTTANLGDLFVFRYNGAKWLEVGRNLALTLS